jgi:hypothetical protein
VRRTLNPGKDDNGPVKGTKVNVDNAGVETTAVARRSFDTGFKIHNPANSGISYESRNNFTRWYQEDGSTQVFRLFQLDENNSSARPGAARSEAFAADDSFEYSNNRTNIWSAHYHMVSRANEGFSIFQSKASDSSDPNVHYVSDGWSVQLNINAQGRLLINERRESDLVVYDRDMTGQGFDVEVHDDGKNYIVFIDGVKKASGSYARHPGLKTTFRWGMYLGSDIVNQGTAIMYVSGARVTTQPGRIN